MTFNNEQKNRERVWQTHFRQRQVYWTWNLTFLQVLQTLNLQKSFIFEDPGVKNSVFVSLISDPEKQQIFMAAILASVSLLLCLATWLLIRLQGWRMTGLLGLGWTKGRKGLDGTGARERIPSPGNPHWKGMISTIDDLVLTRSDQLLFMLKLYFSFFIK